VWWWGMFVEGDRRALLLKRRMPQADPAPTVMRGSKFDAHCSARRVFLSASLPLISIPTVCDSRGIQKSRGVRRENAYEKTSMTLSLVVVVARAG